MQQGVEWEVDETWVGESRKGGYERRGLEVQGKGRRMEGIDNGREGVSGREGERKDN